MIKKWLYVCAFTLGASLVTACASDTPEELLASAKVYLGKKDPKPAVIQLKNALQIRPEWAEARYLLGQALLGGGDPSSAVVELRKARELKHPDDQVDPPLARALVLQGQYKAVTDQFGAAEMSEALSVADLKTSLAVSYLSQGEREKGELALRAALSAVPTFVPALMVETRILVGERNFDAALDLVDKILAGSPDNHEVWSLKGEVLQHWKADGSDALEAYRKALAIRKDYIPAHSGIVAINLSTRNLEGAAQQVASLKSMLPQHPQTKYLEAQVAFDRADNKTAKELMLQLLKLAPDDVRLLQLAGAIELRNQAWVQAETYLQKALHIAPGSRPVRLLLAQTYASSGHSVKALAVVAPLLEGGKQDAPAMAVAAQAHLQAGEMKKAEVLYASAAKLNPADVKSRTALAITHMAMGEVESGFGELQRIAAEDSGTTADLALITTQIRRKEFAAALKSIDTLERKLPGKPMPFHLRGVAEMGLNQAAAARTSFERAVSLDPTYFPAVQSLAALDLADKKPDLARRRFEGLLAVQPTNAQALLAVAALKARGGSTPEEVAKILRTAVGSNPTLVAPRLRLIDQQIANKQLAAALVSAQDAVAAIPNSPELLGALGRVQSLSGDSNQAQASYNKLAAMQPNSTVPHMRLADLHIAAKNMGAARQSLARTLAIKPDLLVAQRNLIALDLAAGRMTEALTMAKTVQAQRPKDGVGFLYEGDVEVARKDFVASAAAYRRGLKVGPSPSLAIKLHAILMLSRKQAEAETFAATWLKNHPQDVAFLMYLGHAAVERKSFDQAERHFGEVVKLVPNHLIALNNLAWAMTKQAKPGALLYAQKANELKPNEPALMETLAVTLALDNQLPKALELQKKVVELQPGNNDFRLSLAKMYIQAGQTSKAKSELTTLSNLGEKYGGRAEVARMLQSL